MIITLLNEDKPCTAAMTQKLRENIEKIYLLLDRFLEDIFLEDQGKMIILLMGNILGNLIPKMVIDTEDPLLRSEYYKKTLKSFFLIAERCLEGVFLESYTVNESVN